jgi:hypothetical protein
VVSFTVCDWELFVESSSSRSPLSDEDWSETWPSGFSGSVLLASGLTISLSPRFRSLSVQGQLINTSRSLIISTHAQLWDPRWPSQVDPPLILDLVLLVSLGCLDRFVLFGWHQYELCLLGSPCLARSLHLTSATPSDCCLVGPTFGTSLVPCDTLFLG